MSGRPLNTTRICPGCGAEVAVTPLGALYAHQMWFPANGPRCPFSGWLLEDAERHVGENATPEPPLHRAVRTAEQQAPS